MRDILPFHFNRLDRKVIFVDPKNEFLRRQRNVDIPGKPGEVGGKIIYPIEDEAHKAVILDQKTIGGPMRKSGCNTLLIEHGLLIGQESERVGSVAIEMWRDLREGRLILDEVTQPDSPEAERLADKLRDRGTKRQSDSASI